MVTSCPFSVARYTKSPSEAVVEPELEVDEAVDERVDDTEEFRSIVV